MRLKNKAVWVITGLGILLILIFLFQLQHTFTTFQEIKELQLAIRNYQISIWVGWILITASAVYTKWKTKNNTLFFIDYIIVTMAFLLLGYYLYQGEVYDLWAFGTSFKQGVVFAILKNILIISLMTAFVQAAIWWFSKRWHRE